MDVRIDHSFTFSHFHSSTFSLFHFPTFSLLCVSYLTHIRFCATVFVDGEKLEIMRTNWQQVRRGEVHSGYAGLYVSLNPKGLIHMNRTCFERLGEPEAFQLLFDPANNRIGLKTAYRKDRDAYPVGKSGRKGGRCVYALRLLNEFAIDLPATVRFFDVEIDQDGVLVLDLRSARVPPIVQGLAKHYRSRRTS